MLGVNYKTKKSLKAHVGQPLRYQETSFFGPEYKPDGSLTVVGPDPDRARHYFARVVMVGGLIHSVS